MSATSSEAIATAQKFMDRDLQKLSNDVAEIRESMIRRESMHTETIAQMDTVVGSIQNLTDMYRETKEDVKTLAASVQTVSTNMAVLTANIEQVEMRVEHIENQSFDWGKFMSGCKDPKISIPLIMMTGLVMMTITVSVFAPESLPELFKFFKTTKVN